MSKIQETVATIARICINVKEFCRCCRMCPRQGTGGGSGGIAGGWGLEFQAPTAANAYISGRVTTADGRPIRNATVTITGNSLPEPIVFQTGSFGYYMFDGLRTGETYIVTVTQRRFSFQMPSRVVTLTDNIADLDFIAGAEVDAVDL